MPDILQRLIEIFKVNPWVFEIFLILFLTAVASGIRRFLLKHAEKKAEASKTLWDDALIKAINKPAGALLWIIGISFAIDVIYVELESEAEIFAAVDPLRSVAIIGTLCWFLLRLIRNIEIGYVKKKEEAKETYDRTTIDMATKLLRLVVMITAALVVMQTLGISITGILAFGGVGGIAVGFAAREMIANFFGGLMLYLDRPFVVGDTITSSDKDIEGTVERIGWRQTEIRRFDSRTLYVPNSNFTTMAVLNMSRQTNRRIFEYVGIRYDDATCLVGIVDDVKAMLQSHPDIDQTNSMMVNFDRFAASSLDIFVYCFTKTVVWADYHQVKQDVLVKVMNIIEQHGAEIAFPTSTLHLVEQPDPKLLDETQLDKEKVDQPQKS